MRARHPDDLMRRCAKLAIAFTGNFHTFHLRSDTGCMFSRLVAVADEKSHHMRVGFHIHIVDLLKVKSVLSSSQASTESNDRTTPAHIIHSLSGSLHSLVLVLVARAEVVIEHNFDSST